MKPIVLCLFVGVLFSATSCKKSEAERAVRNSIMGTWELRRASGQMTINYTPGNGNTLHFTKSTYERHRTGQPAESGTYKIILDASVEQNVCLVIADGRYENRIDFSAVNSPKVFLQLSGDTLHLVSGCFANDSGSFSDYVRIESTGSTE